MTRVTYYPGCSLDSSAWEYRDSMEEAFRHLDYDLVELEDWNCCGATSAHSLDEDLALSLPARNLQIASKSTDRMIVPCAACYSRQKKAQVVLAADPAVKTKFEDMIGDEFERDVSVVNIIDFLSNDIDRIKDYVERPLSNFKVACYYGCLLTRPPKITGDPSHENPEGMDNIVAAIGAEPVEWSYKTECCGASHSIARVDLVHVLISKIFTAAIEAGADAIVTACPMCQTNLDARQKGSEIETGRKFGIPVLYITEILSAALGSNKIGRYLNGHFVGSSQVTRAFDIA